MLCDIIEAHMLHGAGIVVQWVIDVPGLPEAIAVGMEECNDLGNLCMVMIDDVGEVGHSFVALVDRRAQGVCSAHRAGMVDVVYRVLPAENSRIRFIATSICDEWIEVSEGARVLEQTYSGSSRSIHEVSSTSLAGVTTILSLLHDTSSFAPRKGTVDQGAEAEAFKKDIRSYGSCLVLTMARSMEFVIRRMKVTNSLVRIRRRMLVTSTGRLLFRRLEATGY